MKTTWAIAWRDLRSYFTSPIAYIVIAGFMMIMDWMFNFTLVNYQLYSMQYMMGGKGMSITDGIIRPVYGNMNVIFLLMMPFVTMRLLAEEKKQHTIELLLTAPITTTQIVLGKFLSGVLLLTVMLGLTLVYPLILLLTGNPDLGPLALSYLGTYLLGACYISIGLMFSAMTENQIVAGALTFATGLFFWLISWAAQSAGPVWSDILTHLSLIGHFNNFTQGVLNSVDLLYYFSFIGLGLFITHRVLESYRWR